MLAASHCDIGVATRDWAIQGHARRSLSREHHMRRLRVDAVHMLRRADEVHK